MLWGRNQHKSNGLGGILYFGKSRRLMLSSFNKKIFGILSREQFDFKFEFYWFVCCLLFELTWPDCVDWVGLGFETVQYWFSCPGLGGKGLQELSLFSLEIEKKSFVKFWSFHPGLTRFAYEFILKLKCFALKISRKNQESRFEVLRVLKILKSIFITIFPIVVKLIFHNLSPPGADTTTFDA